ncbi:uncharacterized FAD-linked oxidoreductase YitY-like [Condylostylus longicornis]|uniref:uncharacterized FAD-linked oxidoreductase YitY-like n=1 Tax=Condylostylus longicornis TaxID=2530218 RepID=UPI00244E5502|nr:uncharacterized FAD-linked oxidoreductase YitY-like [Condylostylus longicornis]
MRKFNQVLNYSKEERLITVQTGITWRKIIKLIDADNLSVSVMQSYASFTVGGSLSVNVHGRYRNPLISTVEDIKIIVANGTVIQASPFKHSELFYGAIGGYGGLGVITEVTLKLSENFKMERVSIPLQLNQYVDFFMKNLRDDPNVIMHNALLYPDKYSEVRVVAHLKTFKPLTIVHRLRSKKRGISMNRFLTSAMTRLPGRLEIRRQLLDPVRFSKGIVLHRNYEATSETADVEPLFEDTTFILQEYFVPLTKFQEFVLGMKSVLLRYKVDVMNVSIRQSRPDPGSILAWATQEVFAFVVYYQQERNQQTQEQDRVWTRELIDVVLSCGGKFYLPYQIHATERQFHEAYPRAVEFFELKNQIDPEYKFLCSSVVRSAVANDTEELRETCCCIPKLISVEFETHVRKNLQTIGGNTFR